MTIRILYKLYIFCPSGHPAETGEMLTDERSAVESTVYHICAEETEEVNAQNSANLLKHSNKTQTAAAAKDLKSQLPRRQDSPMNLAPPSHMASLSNFSDTSTEASTKGMEEVCALLKFYEISRNFWLKDFTTQFRVFMIINSFTCNFGIKDVATQCRVIMLMVMGSF